MEQKRVYATVRLFANEVQGCQVADYWPDGRISEEKRTQYIKEVEQRVAKASQESGTKSVRYVYTKTNEAVEDCPPRDRRRKWHG